MFVRIIHQGRFNGAIQKGELDEALRQAREMAECKPLTVHESLDLVLLIARSRNSRLDSAIDLWWKKFEAEEPPACDRMIAKAALEGLKRKATRPRCELILRDPMCWVRPEP